MGSVFANFSFSQEEMALVYLSFAACYIVAWWVAGISGLLFKSGRALETLGYAIFQTHLVMLIYSLNFSYLWATKINLLPIIENYNAYVHAVCSVGVLLYINLYFSRFSYTSWQQRTRRALLSVSILEVVFAPFWPAVATIANQAFAPVVIILVGVAIYESFRFGRAVGFSFLFGWLFMLIGVMSFLLEEYGFGGSFLSHYGIYIGSAIEMGTIGFATIYILQHDKREVEKKAEYLERKSIESHRLTEMGELVGSIAHEINNPLAIIQTNASNLKYILKPKEPNLEKAFHFIDEISNTVTRMSHTVQSMKQLVRDGKVGSPIKTNLMDCLAPVITIVQAKSKRKGIHFQMSDIPNIDLKCNPTLISQGFLNIINNAMDAIDEEQDKWIKVQIEPGDKNVTIRVSNSGPCIDFSIEGKIFQPFFTTKPVGRGTGLGLSVCKQVFERHNGKLYLDTQCTDHTTFVAELPSLQFEEQAS